MAAPDPTQLTLAILAGGQGRRLGGAAKGLLRFGGRPLIAAALELSVLATETMIISSDPAYDGLGVRRVTDVLPGRGAPGGVVTALLSSRTPWTLVVACDMPFVTVATAQRLIDVAGEQQVCCYSRDGQLEPLLALYRASLAARWQLGLDHNPSLRSLLATVDVTAITPSDPRALDSINTPAQLEEVKT